jgi:hypothetical protein
MVSIYDGRGQELSCILERVMMMYLYYRQGQLRHLLPNIPGLVRVNHNPA